MGCIDIIKQEFDRLKDDYIVVLFGSISRNEQKPESNVDLLVIEKKKSRSELIKIWDGLPNKINRNIYPDVTSFLWDISKFKGYAKLNDFSIASYLEKTPIVIGKNKDISLINKVSKNSYNHNINLALELYLSAKTDVFNSKKNNFENIDYIYGNLNFSLGYFINALSIKKDESITTYSNIIENPDSILKKLFVTVRNNYKNYERNSVLNKKQLIDDIDTVGKEYDKILNKNKL